MLLLKDNSIINNDRGAVLKSKLLEEEQFQRQQLKGNSAEVKYVLFTCFAGFAFKKCKIVRTLCSGELS